MTVKGPLALDALSNSLSHFTHHRVDFVPAQRQDDLPVIDSLGFIHLKPSLEVCLWFPKLESRPQVGSWCALLHGVTFAGMTLGVIRACLCPTFDVE